MTAVSALSILSPIETGIKPIFSSCFISFSEKSPTGPTAKVIESDMNARNSTSKNKNSDTVNNKTRKKREELSISASKSIKKEKVEIILKFD